MENPLNKTVGADVVARATNSARDVNNRYGAL